MSAANEIEIAESQLYTLECHIPFMTASYLEPEKVKDGSANDVNHNVNLQQCQEETICPSGDTLEHHPRHLQQDKGLLDLVGLASSVYLRL
jgi:hypothetical protein